MYEGGTDDGTENYYKILFPNERAKLFPAPPPFHPPRWYHSKWRYIIVNMLNMWTRFTFLAVAEAGERNEKAKSPFHPTTASSERRAKKAPACQARRTQKLPHNSLLSATYTHTTTTRDVRMGEEFSHEKRFPNARCHIFPSTEAGGGSGGWQWCDGPLCNIALNALHTQQAMCIKILLSNYFIPMRSSRHANIA